MRSRNFRLLWMGTVVSNVGSWMQIVAQGWLVYSLTGSPLDLGLVGLARAVPIIMITPLGGVIADRFPRMSVLRVSQIFNFLNAFGLALLVVSGLVSFWALVVFSFLSGLSGAFDQPARQALVPDLVPAEDLTNAVALNGAVWQGSALVGPALAGVAVALIGMSGAFIAQAIGYLGAVVTLSMMRHVVEQNETTYRRGLFDDFLDGLRFVRGSHLVAALLFLAAAANLFGRAYQQLLPVFAGEVLDVGPTGLGLLLSAPGAGSVVAAVVLGSLGDVRHKGMVQLVGMVVFSGVLVGFATSRDFLLSFGLLVVTGLTFTVFSTMTMTMLQLSTPGPVRGRVMSFMTVVMQGFAPLGALLLGGLATMTGTPTAVALSAGLVALAALASAPLAPELLHFRVPPADRQGRVLA